MLDGVMKVLSSIYMKILYVAVVLAVIIFILACIKMNLSRGKKRKVKYVPYNANERENKLKRDD